ncbi:hypothetical protein Goshw_007743, partial [Gossypium schwendimanii]|nr:hypothetical protein [Gossypium schwendimanii]
MEHLMWSHLWRIYLGKLLEIKGVVEVYIPCGDSHSAVAIRNMLMVYGGDCGDRYHRDVDMFNKDNSIWSRLTVQGSLPGVGVGHAVVSIGTKVFIIGGTRDKHYYNNVWVLNVSARYISICGRCGEDEHPIKELLVLQLGAQHPNVRYNMCTIFGSHWNLEEHSLLLAQYLSPSQSNQEQAPPQKPTSPMVSHGLNLFKPLHHIPSNCQLNSVPNN